MRLHNYIVFNVSATARCLYILPDSRHDPGDHPANHEAPRLGVGAAHRHRDGRALLHRRRHVDQQTKVFQYRSVRCRSKRE